jgi:predicted ArsR family transcriptional regulator
MSSLMSPQAPVLQTTLLALKKVGPMTQADLADTLGIALKTVKMRLHIMKSHGMVENKPTQGGRKVWYAAGHDPHPDALSQVPSIWHYAQRCAA